MSKPRIDEFQFLPDRNLVKELKALIDAGIYTIEDLESDPNLKQILERGEQVSLSELYPGDTVMVYDISNPKKSLIKGRVTYSGEFSTLGYNDKSLITEVGVRIYGRYCFAAPTLKRFIPQTLDVILGMDNYRIIRLKQDAPEQKDLLIEA